MLSISIIPAAELLLGILEKTLVNYGSILYNLARGIGDRKVEPNRKVKSIGKEITFASAAAD